MALYTGTRFAQWPAMPTLSEHAENVKYCLTKKIAIEQKIKAPTLELGFEIRELPGRGGVTSLHLIAVDQGTGTYLYLAESYEPGKWKARGSEFYADIGIFCEHVVRCLKWECPPGLGSENQGKLLVQIAAREYSLLSRQALSSL